MENFFNDILKIFKKFLNNEEIIKYKTFNKKIKCPLKNIIYYKFLNSFLSKEKSIEKIQKNIVYSRTSLYKQEKQISIEYFEKLNEEISKICFNSIPKKDNNKYDFIACDGTYSNGKNYAPSLNLGLYDIFKDMPLAINFEDVENRNKECDVLMNFISNDISLFHNKVFVLDRGYFRYDLINFFIDNDLKFIIRYKGKSGNIQSKRLQHKGKFRIIKLNNIIEKDIVISDEKSKNSSKTKFSVNVKNDMILITNLSKHYNNNDLIELYKKRWSIETYFKLVKNNFNFQHMTNQENDEIKKQLLCTNILTSICKTISQIHLNDNEKDKHDELLIFKCNESKILRFIQDTFLNDIFNDDDKKYSYNNFLKSIKNMLIIRSYSKNRSFDRTCKTPFMKWYIKSYSNKSEITKILRAICNDNFEDLNDNLKSKSKKIEIINKTAIK